MFRGLESEVERITVGRSTDIYNLFSFPLQMSHSFVHLFPSGYRSSGFVTSPEFPFLKQMEIFLPSVVFNLILLSLFAKFISVLIINIYAV